MVPGVLLPKQADISEFKNAIGKKYSHNYMTIPENKAFIETKSKQCIAAYVVGVITFVAIVISAYFIADGVDNSDSLTWGVSAGGLAASAILFVLAVLVGHSANRFIERETSRVEELEKELSINEIVDWLFQQNQITRSVQDCSRWAGPIIEEILKRKSERELGGEDQKEAELLTFFLNELKGSEIEANPLFMQALNLPGIDLKAIYNSKDHKEVILKALKDEEQKRNELIYSCIRGVHFSDKKILQDFGYLESFLQYLKTIEFPSTAPHILFLYYYGDKREPIENARQELFEMLPFEKWKYAFQSLDYVPRAAWMNNLSLDQCASFLFDKETSFFAIQVIKPHYNPVFNEGKSIVKSDKIQLLMGMTLQKIKEAEEANNSAERERYVEIFMKILPTLNTFEFFDDPGNRTILTPVEWERGLSSVYDCNSKSVFELWLKFCEPNEDHTAILEKLESFMIKISWGVAKVFSTLIQNLKPVNVTPAIKKFIVKYLPKTEAILLDVKIYKFLGEHELDTVYDNASGKIRSHLFLSLNPEERKSFVHRMFFNPNRCDPLSYFSIDHLYGQKSGDFTNAFITAIIQQDEQITGAIAKRINDSLSPNWKETLNSQQCSALTWFGELLSRSPHQSTNDPNLLLLKKNISLGVGNE